MATAQTLSATVAAEVNSRLAELNETVAGLVQATGIAERTLRRRLTGRSAWTTDEIDAVATALGMEDASTLIYPSRVSSELLSGNGDAS